MGLVKNGFVDLGNNMFINGELVDHIENDYVVLKSGEKYKYNELPNNDKHDYLDNLYDTNRVKVIGGKVKYE